MISVKNEDITTREILTSALDIARMLVGDVSANTKIVCKTIEQLAAELGANIVYQEGKIVLQKSINNRVWDILTYDPQKNELRVVVDVYRKYKGSVSTRTGIDPNTLNLPLDVKVIKVHEVRGPMDYLLNTDGREITLKDGSKITVEMKLYEAQLPKGDIVRYNGWDFRPYAIYKCQLDAETIACESDYHKRECIKLFAKDYCEGKLTFDDGVITPELDATLRKVYAGEISPSYLPGYEIHHNGYGEMLFLPNDIHCRKLSHIGGSWLMNESKYITLSQTKVENVCANTLYTHLQTSLKGWNSLSLELRESKIITLGEELLQKLQIDASIQFEPLGDFAAGFYNDNTIILNARLLEFQTPMEIIQTLFHEIYHAVQQEALRSPQKYDISQFELELWRKNFANYITPELDYQEYIKQPVEYAAEKFAHDLTDKYFANYV